MPAQYREFLRAVSCQTSLRVFVEESGDVALKDTYGACLKQLQQWRGSHISVVSKYIIRPARFVDTTSTSTGNIGSEDDTLKGTAGSALIPFLKQARDATGDARLE